MAEELAFKQPGRNGGTVELHEGMRASGAHVVNRGGDELLAGAGFAIDEHRRSGRAYCRRLLENAPQGGALADDALAVQIARPLVIAVHLFVGQPDLQFPNLGVRECAVQHDGQLVGELRQECDVVLIIGPRLTPTEDKRAQDASPAHQGHRAGAPQPTPEQQRIAIRADSPGIVAATGP